MTAFRLRAVVAALLAGAAIAGCDTDLDVTNPNARSTENFWKSANDALQGTNAVYAGLLPLGTYGRWQVFVNDLRSDLGTARTSPWADLANFGRFQLPSYNWEISIHTWTDHYRGISRANQVIGNVPNIEMDAELRARYVGEAKFIRALLYFNLVNLYGGNIPLLLDPVEEPSLRPPSSTTEAVYAQIEAELAQRIAEGALRPGIASPLDAMRAGAEMFLDSCTEPEVQQITLLDGPSVLGWDRWREIGAEHGLGLIEATLQAAIEAGAVAEQPVRPLAHVLMGALDEAAMLVARAEDPKAARAEVGRTIDTLVAALSVDRDAP